MKNLRNKVPILAQKIDGKPLIYLDSASTAQKPQAVLDAMNYFYTHKNANIGRGIYTLAEQATAAYEEARDVVAHYIGTGSKEIIFTSGATEGINLVAYSWAMHHIQAGDEIAITALEHHANLLPWQRVAHERNATLKIIPITNDGRIEYEKLNESITEKTKLVAFLDISNAIGTHIDIQKLVIRAQEVGARTLLDASQSAPHMQLNVQDADVDFAVFSAHKMGGPTGVGALYIKYALHEQMKPYQLGGGMVSEVSYQSATWLSVPAMLEAGTPPIAQAIGFAQAIKFLEDNISSEALQLHEVCLTAQLIDGLQSIPKIKILGPVDQLRQRGHLVSFVVDGMHAHDVAAYLNKEGICVRAGHFCTQPLMKRLGVDAAVRASFYWYTTAQEIELFLGALHKL